MNITRQIMAAAAALAIAAPLFAADTPDNSRPAAAREPSVRERLANARKLLDQKRFDAAMTELDAVVDRDPDNADAHNLLGYSWRKRPNPDLVKAIEQYQIALKINPDHLGVHEYIGEAYLMKKDPGQAEKHLAELERICGNRTCEPYRELAKSIADYKTRN
ncbi:MAG TPA: tetratricopeptide repeat protein [Ramlibacter sp.]|uniref:tetratricopeptide repeat protein n=1 Tax=Ramlibacter sp. TaxID=1917967 RepID=UPI002B745312|nr:tetratricopeptide repeat protein [Ramlibacter sp.]HVZ46727.1 tetratricopeptide repeat protein [Ramlibacter sp.]